MTLEALGRKYGCTKAAAWNHIRKHMGEALRQADLTQTVLDQLRSLQRRIDRILAKAEAAEDLPTALKAVHEARENLLAIGRLTGEDRSIVKSEPLTIEIVYVDRPRVVASHEDDPLLLPGGE
jgi:hypothetical protein